MTDDGEELVPVFIPALSAVLLNAEDQKGEPLTYDEVVRIRDKAPCIMMRIDHAQQMAESRGGDINPENCWYDWQLLRRELGRKPDLDPGPKFYQVRSADREYQQTIRDAQNRLSELRSMLPADGKPRCDALVKIEIDNGGNSEFLWLSNTRMAGLDFVAEFFEVPANLKSHAVGDAIIISCDALLDWMVNDGGVLHGGFSIRYHRSQLPENERPAYDDYLGVTEYR